MKTSELNSFAANSYAASPRVFFLDNAGGSQVARQSRRSHSRPTYSAPAFNRLPAMRLHAASTRVLAATSYVAELIHARDDREVVMVVPARV